MSGLIDAEMRRKQLVVAGIHDVERNVGLAQQVETLVDEPDVELVVGVVVQVVRERAEVVDLQAVDDVRFGAELLQLQRDVVADESSAADQRNTFPRKIDVHAEFLMMASFSTFAV